VARGSLWARLRLAEARLSTPGAEVEGIIRTMIDPDEKKLCGIVYRACSGYEPPLDGQSITFHPPILRWEIPEGPWRDLLFSAEESRREADAKNSGDPTWDRLKRSREQWWPDLVEHAPKSGD
jgi:hypothetical protein